MGLIKKEISVIIDFGVKNMKVFVCIDDNLGMMFNNRRQSRDSAVKKQILEMSCGEKLLMNKYSGKLFSGCDVVIEECFLDNAKEGDWCFVEDVSLKEYYDKIEKIIAFKWNRNYPSDKKLDIDLSGLVLEESFDFVGSSHDKITCEIWKK